MRHACPECKVSFKVSILKQHCFNRHSYTQAKWQRFLRRLRSQSLINVLDCRARGPSGQLPKPSGAAQRRSASPVSAGVDSGLTDHSKRRGWKPPEGAWLYDEDRVRPVVQCWRCGKIIRTPHHKCRPEDITRAEKRRMLDPDLTGVEEGNSFESSRRRH